MSKRFLRAGLLAVVAVCLVLVLFGAYPAATQDGFTGLHAQGNTLLDGNDSPVQLHGVNRSGAEYACLRGPNAVDGPTDAASVRAMAAWHINAVRIPLNEDCWLGINGVAVGGSAYQAAITAWVQALTSAGMYVILDLHWSAPGTTLADGQMPMPDADHAPDFWNSVAETFKDNQDVAYDLFNEPYPDHSTITPQAWLCLRDGGAACPDLPYQAVGLQTLVSVVRATGARNLILAAGVAYSGAFSLIRLGLASLWLQYRPIDPLNNLAASWHAYNNSACSTIICWVDTIAPVAARVPVIVGETGDTDCTVRYSNDLLPWLDVHQISYLAWTWGTTYKCQSLISDYAGTPTQPYGSAYRQHLSSFPAPSPFPEPTAAPTDVAATPTPIPHTPIRPGPMHLSATIVHRGGRLEATVTLVNGGAAVTLVDVAIAARPPGGTNGGGPYLDLGHTGPVTLAAGQRLTVRESRSFGKADPNGRWYSYVTYQTIDHVWHDSTGRMTFRVLR